MIRLLQLPDALVGCCLSNLDTIDRLVARYVCKRWHVLCVAPISWTDGVISCDGDEKMFLPPHGPFRNLKPKVLLLPQMRVYDAPLPKHFSRVEHLRARYLHPALGVREMPKLRILELESAYTVDGLGFSLEQLQQMEELRLGMLRGPVFMSLLHQMPKLHSLTLTFPKDADLCSLRGLRLTKLNMKVSDLTDAGLLAISSISTLSRLKIALMGNNTLPDRSWSHLSQLPSLTRLALVSFSLETESALIDIFKGMTALRRLDMKNLFVRRWEPLFSRVTGLCLTSLSISTGQGSAVSAHQVLRCFESCPQLNRLRLSHRFGTPVWSLLDKGNVGRLGRVAPNLTALHLSGHALTTAAATIIVQMYPGLIELELTITELPDSALTMLCSLPLRHLLLANVNPTSYAILARLAPSLRILRFAYGVRPTCEQLMNEMKLPSMLHLHSLGLFSYFDPPCWEHITHPTSVHLHCMSRGISLTTRSGSSKLHFIARLAADTRKEDNIKSIL